MKNILLYMLLILTLLSCSNETPDTGNTDVDKVNVSEQLDVKPSEFQISAVVDTMIFAEQGTAVFIEANSLVFEDGSIPETPVIIKIKEYYSMSDILTQNLSTLSNGEILETGGMINIEAYSNDSPLKLKSGKDIIVHFPKGDIDKKMQLFSGELNEQEQIVWNEEYTNEGYVKDDIVTWYTKYDGLDDQSLYQADGESIYKWINAKLKLTKSEQDYLMFKDIDLHYYVNKNGKLSNIHFKKKVDKNFKKRILNIMDSIPLLKPYTISGEPIKMPGWLKFAVEYIPPAYAKNESYTQTIEQKYPEFEKKSISDISKAELHYYIFNSAKLGWLNVDRFVDDPAPKVDMSIKVKKPEDVMIKMVYKDFKSVIPPEFKGKTHHFKQIPINKDITIIVIRHGEKDVEMSITEQKTKQGKITDLEFKNYTMGELKAELEKLN